MSVGLTSVQNYQVTQGAAKSVTATLNQRLADGTIAPVTRFDGTQPVTTTIWPGGETAASFLATTTWTTYSPATNTVTFVITDAQTSSVAPGEYEGMVRINDAGSWVDAYAFTLTILPFAGGIPAINIPTIVTIAEAAAAVPLCCNLESASLYQLVADVTDALNATTGRILPLMTHDEVYAPELTRTVRLKQYPVVSISRVAAGLTTAFTILNPTLVRPTVTLIPSTTAADDAAVPTGLTFNGYSSGMPVSPTTLMFTDYPTITLLSNAINALGSGWNCTLNNTPSINTPSTDLNNDWGVKGAAQTGAWYRVYTRDLYQYDTNFKTGVIAIYEDLYAGRRYPDRIWGSSGPYGTIRVRYQAGYNNDPTAGPVTMPNGLKRAAFILIQAMIQQTQVGIQTSQKLSLSAWTVKPAMLELVADLVAPYRRRRIA